MTVPFFTRFKNVTFDILSTEDVGIFDVKSKFLGVEMEKVQLNIQVGWALQTGEEFCSVGHSWPLACTPHDDSEAQQRRPV